MSFDLKGLLEKSGVVIAVAEAARDSVVERINKESERLLTGALREIRDLQDQLRVKEAALISLRESLDKAEMEIARLKLHADDPNVEKK